jgi:hypothetical protein
MDTIPADFCSRIVELDKNIRFAGVADRFGKVIMAEYRKGLVPLLSKEESVLSVMQSSIRMGTRKTLQPTLGRVVYSMTLYEKVVLASVPLNNLDFLVVSFDTKADNRSVILKKILPLVKKLGLHKD